MGAKYYELIIRSPFLLVKGFLMGYMHGRGESFKYFFHRKAGIRRETLGEILKEYLTIDNYTHLCLPEDVTEHFVTALKRAEPTIGITVEKKRPIAGAEFTFSFDLYNENQIRQCKELFEDIPAGVELINFHPLERRDVKLKGIKEYAPMHPFIYQGQGTAQGDFEAIVDFYLKIKRSELADFILCSEIRLHYAEA